MGINQFSDISELEFLEVYGKSVLGNDKPILKQTINENEGDYDEKGRYICKHDDELHNFFDYNDYKYIDTQLKRCGNQIDWVKLGKVSPSKQQSTCGSCWAHSAIASIETLHAIVHNNMTTFSEQQLVDCNFLPNLGCLGGRRQFAFDYVVQNGLTTSDKYPYKNVQQECSYNQTHDMVFKIDHFKAYEIALNSDIEKLVCQGVVSVSIRINDCIKNYKSGIIYDGGNHTCGCSAIGGTNHAVAIVGFGRDFETEGPCTDYWLVKNSWGTEWGEAGYFRVCKENDETLPLGTCNIRSEPMIALLNKNDV